MAKVILRDVFTHSNSESRNNSTLLEDVFVGFSADDGYPTHQRELTTQDDHYLRSHQGTQYQKITDAEWELFGSDLKYADGEDDASLNTHPESGTINELSYRNSNISYGSKTRYESTSEQVSITEIDQELTDLQSSGVVDSLFSGDDDFTLVDALYGPKTKFSSGAVVNTGDGNDTVDFEIVGGATSKQISSVPATTYFNVNTGNGDDTINPIALTRFGAFTNLTTGEGQDKIVLSSTGGEPSHFGKPQLLDPEDLQHVSTIRISDFDPLNDTLELPLTSAFDDREVEWGLVDNQGEAMIVSWTREAEELSHSYQSEDGVFYSKIQLVGIPTQSVSFNTGGGTVEFSTDGSDLGMPVLMSLADTQSEEGEEISGTAQNDTLFGTGGDDVLSGFEGNDFLNGLKGNDTIDGGAGDDTLLGGDGNDTLFGGQGADTLLGGKGHDTLISLGDNNTLLGGSGNDFLQGGGLNSVLKGGYGNDQLHGSDTNDHLSGDMGNDVLHGYGGNDTLIGGNGHDGMFGGDGADKLIGGGGDDYIEGNDGADDVSGGYSNDILLGNAGNDVVQGGYGDDNIAGGKGNDLLFGETSESAITTNHYSSTNDIIDGGAGDDVLDGGTGANILFGGVGNDILFAGGGYQGDVLFGDAGDDIIFGGEGDDYIVAGTGTDIVLSGKGTDLLKLEADSGLIFWNDFEKGTDRIDATFINQGNETGSFHELVQVASTQDGTGTWIGFAGTELILDSVSADQIDEEDFFLPDDEAA